jgi:hypothetical protein
MNAVTKRIRSDAGIIGIVVPVMLLTLAGGAALLSAAITNAENNRTIRILTDPEATQQQLDTVSDQDITNARNNFKNQADLATGFVSLGTAPLPGEHGAPAALSEVASGIVQPTVVNYVSDPSSSWNTNNGADRPTEGTAPVDPTTVPDPEPVDPEVLSEILFDDFFICR